MEIERGGGRGNEGMRRERGIIKGGNTGEKWKVGNHTIQ